MKKILILTTIVLTTLFVGCGNKENKEDKKVSQEVATNLDIYSKSEVIELTKNKIKQINDLLIKHKITNDKGDLTDSKDKLNIGKYKDTESGAELISEILYMNDEEKHNEVKYIYYTADLEDAKKTGINTGITIYVDDDKVRNNRSSLLDIDSSVIPEFYEIIFDTKMSDVVKSEMLSAMNTYYRSYNSEEDYDNSGDNSKKYMMLKEQDKFKMYLFFSENSFDIVFRADGKEVDRNVWTHIYNE